HRARARARARDRLARTGRRHRRRAGEHRAGDAVRSGGQGRRTSRRDPRARDARVSLEVHLRSRREDGRKLLVPYVTGGFDGWADVVRAVVDAGADAVEIGIPFSDPVMDGPTIQAASQAALARGATPTSILAEARDLDVDVPLAVMTYCN